MNDDMQILIICIKLIKIANVHIDLQVIWNLPPNCKVVLDARNKLVRNFQLGILYTTPPGVSRNLLLLHRLNFTKKKLKKKCILVHFLPYFLRLAFFFFVFSSCLFYAHPRNTQWINWVWTLIRPFSSNSRLNLPSSKSWRSLSIFLHSVLMKTLKFLHATSWFLVCLSFSFRTVSSPFSSFLSSPLLCVLFPLQRIAFFTLLFLAQCRRCLFTFFVMNGILATMWILPLVELHGWNRQKVALDNK